MPGFGFQRSCCLYYPMGFLVYVMRWWRVRFWPNADNTGHVINAAVLLFQCKSIVAVSAIREWRTLPHLPRDRGR
jgi:hypothetical protein